MKKYLLTEIPHNTLNAGYKAKNDIRTVLLSEGFEAIDVKECFKFDKIPEFLRLIKKLRLLENDAEIVLQSPIYSFFNAKFMPRLLRLFEKKAFKIILVIHDLESARFAQDEDSVGRERRLLELSSKIIVHNPSMKKYVSAKLGIGEEKCVDLGIFDYLCDEVLKERSFENTVCLAGNLDVQKSGYLYRLGEMGGVRLNVYGGNFAKDAATDSITYRGSFEPHELPQNLEACFGLVWDGESAESCVGVTGEYLKINNPHKTSLYLAAGLPVIIWSQAALAPFVEKNGVGIVVDSLFELKDKLAEFTDEDYGEMLSRVKNIGAHLRRGAFIKGAVKKAEEDL